MKNLILTDWTTFTYHWHLLKKHWHLWTFINNKIDIHRLKNRHLWTSLKKAIFYDLIIYLWTFMNICSPSLTSFDNHGHLLTANKGTVDVILIDISIKEGHTSRYNKVVAVRLYAPNRLNLLLLKGQRCVDIPSSENL